MNREEFEKWLADYVKQEPKNFNRFMYKLMTVKEAWQEATTRQQKIIDELNLKLAIKNDMITALNLTVDELKSQNPDVPCPACKGESEIVNAEWCVGTCAHCAGTGKISTVKALQYDIEQLKKEMKDIWRC